MSQIVAGFFLVALILTTAGWTAYRMYRAELDAVDEREEAEER